MLTQRRGGRDKGIELGFGRGRAGAAREAMLFGGSGIGGGRSSLGVWEQPTGGRCSEVRLGRRGGERSGACGLESGKQKHGEAGGGGGGGGSCGRGSKCAGRCVLGRAGAIERGDVTLGNLLLCRKAYHATPSYRELQIH